MRELPSLLCATPSGGREAEAIAEAADRLDPPRAGRVVLDLAAQVAHVDVDDVDVAGAVAAQAAGDLRARLHTARLLGEGEEEVELRARHCAEGAVDADLAPMGVDLQ